MGGAWIEMPQKGWGGKERRERKQVWGRESDVTTMLKSGSTRNVKTVERKTVKEDETERKKYECGMRNKACKNNG